MSSLIGTAHGGHSVGWHRSGRLLHCLSTAWSTVEERPSRDLLREMDVPPDETLFGVFTGVPLPERSVTEPPLYPDVILIFREPLMDACQSREELEEEIAVTVVHELAHYLGLSEERLEELGYG